MFLGCLVFNLKNKRHILIWQKETVDFGGGPNHCLDPQIV